MGLFDKLLGKKDLHTDHEFKNECSSKIKRIKQAIQAKHEEEGSNDIEYFTIKTDLDRLLNKVSERVTSSAAQGKINKALNERIRQCLDKMEAISKYNGLSIVSLISYLTKVLNSLFDVYNGATNKNPILDDKMQAEIFEKTVEVQFEYLDIKDKVEALEKQIEEVKAFARTQGNNPAQLEKCKNMILGYRNQIAQFDRQVAMSSRALDQLLHQAGVITEGEFVKRTKVNVTIKDFEKRMHENTKAMEDLYEQFEENDNTMSEYEQRAQELGQRDKTINVDRRRQEDIQIQMEQEQFEEKQPTTLADLENL